MWGVYHENPHGGKHEKDGPGQAGKRVGKAVLV
jgi:hypothetical protein